MHKKDLRQNKKNPITKRKMFMNIADLQQTKKKKKRRKKKKKSGILKN